MFGTKITMGILALLGTCPVLAGEQQSGAYTHPRSPRVQWIAPDGAALVSLVELAEDAQPTHWIGLRLSPVPEPLAAHIGNEGLMVANIAEGGPADGAGLQRFDVITRFNGKSIDGMEALLSAVAEASTSKPSKLELIRGGQTQTVSIQPVERPSDLSNLKFKFDEPSADEQSIQMRGKKLQLGPGGQWMMHDLGPLMNLPDGMKFNFKLDHGPGNWMFQAPMFDMDNLHGGAWFSMDDDEDVHQEMEVSISRDGESLSVHRDADGKYTVEKSGKDGKESSATYGDREEFEKQDPEAYGQFRHMTGGSVIQVRPRSGQLPQMRKQFQDRVQSMIDRARNGKEEDNATPGGTKPTTYTMNQNGQTTSVCVEGEKVFINVSRDGNTAHYEFKSVADLKKQQPDLYAQVKSFLEKGREK